MTVHGTTTAYAHGGCRCGLCSEAHRMYHRKLRVKLLADMAADPHHRCHGTEFGYRCGCRCTSCSTAKARHMAAYNDRKKART